MKKIISIIIVSFILISSFSFAATATEENAIIDYSSVNPSLTNITGVSYGRENLIEAETKDSVPCIRIKKDDASGNLANYSWIIFDVDKKFIFRNNNCNCVEITVDYYDEGNGFFCLTYDSRTNRNKPTEFVDLTNTKQWKKYTFKLYDAYFGNRHRSKDFSLCLIDDSMDYSTSDVIIKSITVTKKDEYFPINISENIHNTGNYYFKGETPTLSLILNNISAEVIPLNYYCTITNSNNDEVKKINNSTNLNVGENLLNIYTGITDCDTYDVNLFFTNNNKLNGEYKTNFSISVKADKNESYGTNNHYRIESRDSSLGLPLEENMGVSIIRDGFRWNDYEGTKGVYALKEHWVTMLNEAEKNNLEVCILLNGTSPFYDDNTFPKSDEAIEAFGNYVYNIVSDLKGKVKYFEIWNEFHHYKEGGKSLPASAYVKLLKEAYNRAKEANPECVVIGLGGLPGVWDYWVSDMFSEGAGNYMDAMSLHEYDEYGAPEKRMLKWIKNVKSHMETYGLSDMPIWITETGWSSSWAISSTEERKYVFGVRQYAEYAELGVDKYFWYDFMSDGVTTNDYQDNFGNIYYQTDNKHLPLSARASYVAFANMNDKLAGLSFVNHTKNDDADIYKFSNDSTTTYLMWDLSSENTISMRLDKTKKWYLVDILGNEKVLLPNSNGDVTIAVGETPCYVTNKETKKIENNPENVTVTGIDYSTGDISVSVSGLNESASAVIVLKPNCEQSDIYEKRIDALAYIGQPNKGAKSFFFKFTAEEEGNYTICVFDGKEIVQLGTAYYKPLALNAYITQGTTNKVDFKDLNKASPYKVECEIDNSYYKDASFVLVIGIYKDNQLIDMIMENKEVASNESLKKFEFEVMPEEKDFNSIKVFMLEDKNTVKPICNAVNLY